MVSLPERKVQLLEKTLGFMFVAGLPALALLTALQPLGRFYLASTSAFVALFFWCFHLAMDGADGPVGFGVGLYFAFVGAAFLVAHAIKYLVVILKFLVRFMLKASKQSHA
jgi:hypothetical protein